MDNKAAFPLGQKVDVFVAHVHDESGNFFVQLNNEEAGKLDELMAEIETFILSKDSQGLTPEEIKAGTIYLAQYSEDARWYRARVVAVKAGICEVHFIDYGNTEQIPIKFLRIANPSFLYLPEQVFECALEDINKFRGPHFQEAVTTLKTLILEQELSCVRRSVNNGVLIVNLFKDVNCRDSILFHLLSQVQRTPQSTIMDGCEPVQNTEKKCFKTVPLSKHDYEDFCVTDVNDPHSFSCQFVRDSEALLGMMDEIAKEYEGLKRGDLQLHSSSVGYPCCARFSEDLCWYRAIITKSSSVALGSLDVKFVDYGNVQTTPVSDVKELKDKFLELPAQTIECMLHGIRPENGIEWLPDAKALFSKLTKNKHIVGEICGNNSDGKYEVKLVDTTGEMDMQVDQILIAAKYAEKISGDLQGVARSQSIQGKSTSSHQMQPPQPSYIPQENTKIPLFPYVREVLTPGKDEKVLVSSVDSPSLFYCMLYRTSAELEKLMSNIKRHYSGLSAEEDWLANPSVGDPCCAQFSEDQSWYRGLVTDVSSSGKTQVLFIDYGNSERVSAKGIKRLAPQFSDLPCQGIKCTLSRICPKGKDWKGIDVKTFKDLALECTGKLTVIAIEDDGLHRVELVVFEKGKENNLAECMLLKGNAALLDGAVTQSENLASVTQKKFAKMTVNTGGYEDIFVSHVEDPSNFWCQLCKHQDDLNNVMNAIHSYCTSSSDVIRVPSLGLACCANFSEDKAWYRASITGIKKHNIVEVHFVDYGNYDEVPLSNLRVIKPEFMELPAQAFRCRLAQLDVSTLIHFPPEAIDKFCELTVDKELVLMIESFDQTKEQYLTLLLDGTENIFETIAHLMPQASSKEIAVLKQNIKPGRKENVCVTTVSGFSDFYCQMMCSATQLDELMIAMDAHYKALAPDQEQLTQPKVGSYCVGQYTEDDSWYRAKIIGTKNNLFEVVYIDFGNGESLPLSRMKKLSQAFSQLPQQGVFCYLAGNNSEFSDSQFVELALDHIFDMEVVSVENDDKTKVELSCTETKRSLREQLTKQQSEPLLKILPNLLKVGTSETVFVALASSIFKFYCHLSKMADSLASVMDKMYSYYNNLAGNQDAVFNPKVGEFCAAKYVEDDGWYRAVVNNVHNNGVEVFYVDYGNSEVLSLERVKKLKPEFVELPSQAIECSLNNVEVLSDGASTRFLELASDPEIQYELKVISIKMEKLFVDLMKKETGESIYQILVKEGFLQAKEKPTQSKMGSVSLAIGCTKEGQCGYAVSPSQFWFNLNSDVDALNSLLGDIAAYYESLSPSDCLLSSPAVGDYCCCQYTVDQGWYRAKVTSVQGSQVEVHFVDFGNSEVKPASSLKVLKEEFTALPEQAVLCSLNHAIPADNSTTWSPHAVQEFTDLIVEKDAVIRVIQKLPNNCHLVDVLDTEGSVDVALGPLIEKGLAINPNKNIDYKPFTVTSTEDSGYIDINPVICNSPQDFYCQVISVNNIKAFGELVYKLHDTYSAMGPSDNNLVKPEIGMPCCAFYADDESWNRAKITCILAESLVKVFFVDYGNQEEVNISKVKCLLPKFTELPVQCAQFCLSGIKPISGTQWSDKAKKRFADLVVHKQLVAKPVNLGEGNKMEVSLFDTNDDTQDINIGETLVKEKLAAWVSSSTPTVQRPTITMKTLGSLENLKVSSGEVLYITAVESPDSIYCQLSGTEEKLDNLMTGLAAFYESIQARELSVQSLSVSQVCAALFSEDNAWYRAVTTKISSGSVTVRFIDYGNTENLSINNIRILGEEFTKEPVLAVKCRLSGVKPPEGASDWPKEAIAFLENVGGHDGFEVKVISSGDIVEVKLHDQQGDLSDRLIKEGLAVANQQMAAKPVNKPKKSSPKRASKIFKSPEIQVGKKIEVYVTDVKSPGEFCCQLAKFGDELNQMMDTIYDTYSSQDETTGCLVSPVVGQPCVAVFEGDGSWYRAEVQDMTLKDLNVKFVDYGNVQTVKPFQVKQIETRFMTLPKLAIECTVDFQRSNWTKEETDKFNCVIGEDKRLAEIVGEENGRYQIKIYQDSECITNLFLRKQAKPAIPSEVLQENKGHVEDVYVVFLFSSKQFFLQLSKYSDALDEVMATIENACRSDNIPIEEETIEIGMPCCALFEEGWYRATVKSKPLNGKVDVHYMDYGNTATVPLSDLRALPESCFKLPKQAINCTYNNPKVSTISKEKFENAVMDKLLKAKFLKCVDGCWLVELEDDGKDVADNLLQDLQTTPKTTSFTDQVISENSSAQVYVSHTVSQDEVYLQLSSSTKLLEDIGTRLNTLYSEPGQSMLLSPEMGSVCCAQFSEDGSWYRSIVTALPDDRHVEVQFIDYGNSDLVDPSKVLVLKEEFMDIPVLAIKCSIDSKGVHWTDKTIEEFGALVCDQELEGIFIHKNTDNWQVRLNKDGNSLPNLLIENQDKNMPSDVSDVSHVSQIGNSINNKLITAGQEFKCSLSHVEGAGSFYVQMNDEPLLDKVTHLISEIYPSLGPSQECLGQCQVGTLCVVRFSEDQQWYRAIVTEILSESEAKVMFIDFGNSEVVNISSIKSLRPDLYGISKLAIPCRLANAKDNWTENDTLLLEEKMFDKTLQVQFVCATENGWNVTVNTEGTCLNTLFQLPEQAESCSFTRTSFQLKEKEQVIFLMAESLDCIYAQPKNTEHELLDLMNAIAESKPSQITDVSEISVGMPCLAKFTEDCEWYRAEVVACKEEQIHVYYVDYGNSEKVDSTSISPICQSFLQLPTQAVKFGLVDVPKESESLILNKLNEEYPEVTLEAEITNQNGSWMYSVKLFDQDGRDLVQKLINSSESDVVETKEPLATVDSMSEEKASTEALSGIKAEGEEQDEKDHKTGGVEFSEAPKNVNVNESSGGSSDSLAESTLPILASETPLNNDSSSSNTSDAVLVSETKQQEYDPSPSPEVQIQTPNEQGLEVSDPKTAVTDCKESVLSEVQPKSRQEVMEINGSLTAASGYVEVVPSINQDSFYSKSNIHVESTSDTIKPDMKSKSLKVILSEKSKDVPPECQEELPSGEPKGVPPECQEELPSGEPKDVPAECQEELSSGEHKDVAPECQEESPSGEPEDVPAECQEELPSGEPKDVPAECQEELSSGEHKDVAPECQEESPSGEPEDVPAECQEELPLGEPKDVPPECQEELPSGEPKNVASECQEELPSGEPKNVPPECHEELLSGEPEDVASECQEELPSGEPKDVQPECQEELPSGEPKDVAPEYQEELPSGEPKDVASECQEELPLREPEDVAPECQEELPSIEPDVAAECQKELPSGEPEDVPAECQEELPSGEPEDVASECQKELPSDEPKDVAPECQEELPSGEPKGVPPECQEELPSGEPEDVPPEFQGESPNKSKDVAPECQEELPSGEPEDVAPECQEESPSGEPEDVPPECQGESPSNKSKDVAPECQEELPSIEPDVASECQEELPSGEPKHVATECRKDLPSKKSRGEAP